MNRVQQGIAVVFLLAAQSVPAQFNRWSNTAGGVHQWETAGNWTLGTPASTHLAFITNGVSGSPSSRFVLINATTVGTPTSMSISNLTVLVPAGTVGFTSLQLENAGATPLDVKAGVTIGRQGQLVITNSSLLVHGFGGGLFVADNNVVFNSGTIQTYFPCSFPCLAKAAETVIGSTRTAAFTMAAGRWDSGPVQLGPTYGTLTVNGGSVTMNSTFSHPTGFDIQTGKFWLNGGEVVVAGGGVGRAGGNGEMVVSNGMLNTGNGFVLGSEGGTGTLTVAGGTNVFAQLILSLNAGSRGDLWQTGGRINFNDLYIGFADSGQMTLSNGSVVGSEVFVSLDPGTVGTLNIHGGTMNVSLWMYLGNNCNSTGIVNITGGELTITNGAGNARLEMNTGTVTLSGGTLRVNHLVMSNSCSRFVQTGGTLIYDSAFLVSTNDADGDDLPNGYEQEQGLDPLNPNDAAGWTLDSDGDGLTDREEFQVFTDYTNSASRVGILSFVVVGNTYTLTYVAPGKVTNNFERSTGDAQGGLSNNFQWFESNYTSTPGLFTNFISRPYTTNRYFRMRFSR